MTNRDDHDNDPPLPRLSGKFFGFHFDAKGAAAFVVVALGLMLTSAVVLQMLAMLS